MAIISPCRGTTEQWKTANPILNDGELGVERKADGTCITRIGNGKDRYFDLPILSDSSIFPKLNETAASAEQAVIAANDAAGKASEVYERLKDTDVSGMEKELTALQTGLEQHIENTNWGAANHTHRLDNLPVKKTSFRYLRDCLDGHINIDSGTTGVASHWILGQIYANGEELASKGELSANFTPKDNNPLRYYVNGSTSKEASRRVDYNGPGLGYIQIDLGTVRHDIDYVKVWHYYGRPISYNHKLLVSDDGETWYTLFDSDQQGTYTESETGRTHYLNDTYVETGLNSKEPAIEDTGWVVLELLGRFSTYSSRPLRIRRIGNLVEIRGEIRADPNLGVIAVLPAWGIPSVRVCTLQQGGEYNIWMLNVYNHDGSGEAGRSGELTATRYRTGGVASKPPDDEEGHWMPIHVTYYVD